jgi:hypothetical protein
MDTPTGGPIHAPPLPGATVMIPAQRPASLCVSPHQQLYTLSGHQSDAPLLAERTYLIPRNVPFQAAAQYIIRPAQPQQPK